jgi:hypothetical protein
MNKQEAARLRVKLLKLEEKENVNLEVQNDVTRCQVYVSGADQTSAD